MRGRARLHAVAGGLSSSVASSGPGTDCFACIVDMCIPQPSIRDAPCRNLAHPWRHHIPLFTFGSFRGICGLVLFALECEVLRDCDDRPEIRTARKSTLTVYRDLVPWLRAEPQARSLSGLPTICPSGPMRKHTRFRSARRQCVPHELTPACPSTCAVGALLSPCRVLKQIRFSPQKLQSR